MKLILLLKYLKEDEPFGKLTAFVSVVEFQKRVLVYTHIISFLDGERKFSLQDSTKIDNLISAEIPLATSPLVRELVLKHMIQAPCSDNPETRYMREERCSKTFANQFSSEIVSTKGDNFVNYGRRSPE